MIFLEKEQIRYACPNCSKFPILLPFYDYLSNHMWFCMGNKRKKPICICVKNFGWRTMYNWIHVGSIQFIIFKFRSKTLIIIIKRLIPVFASIYIYIYIYIYTPGKTLRKIIVRWLIYLWIPSEFGVTRYRKWVEGRRVNRLLTREENIGG
jgi:hypothetical protein